MVNSIWVCTTNVAGKKTCKLSPSTKAKIAIACVFVLLLFFIAVICFIIHKRRAALAASEQEYNVEASQVDGPPTIIATEYNPTSGPSGVYGGSPIIVGSPNSGFRSGQSNVQMTAPAYPAAAQTNYNPYRTAPVTQTTFPAYPFTPNVVPQTAFVGGGFPRALLAGNRLKEKLKERPASVSQIV